MKGLVQIDIVWGNIVKEMRWSGAKGLHHLGGGKVKIWKEFWGCVKGINFGEFYYSRFLEIDETRATNNNQGPLLLDLMDFSSHLSSSKKRRYSPSSELITVIRQPIRFTQNARINRNRPTAAFPISKLRN